MSRDDETAAGGSQPAEPSTGFGAIDAAALRKTRDLFVEMEPLVESATLDGTMNPQTLDVELADGVGDASTARIDVQWSVDGNYAFHYTDDRDRDLRFDRHPKPEAPRRHFHPPPDATSDPVEPSCIAVTDVALVTRAVLKRWRDAYDSGTLDGVNDAENPP